jgi:probable phosphoglycerate mutase
VAEVDGELVERNYREYEGKTTAEIHQRRPKWQLFRDGCPGGESVAQVSARADRVIARLRGVGGNVLVFSSGHILRVLAARWCGLDAAVGKCLYLGTAALSALGYEHGGEDPVVRLWNDVGHVGA